MATPDQPGHGRARRVLPFLLVAVGVAVVVFALLFQARPPTPPPSAAGTIDTGPPATPSSPPTPDRQPSTASPRGTPSAPASPRARPKPSPQKTAPKKTGSKQASPQPSPSRRNRAEVPVPPSEPVSISIPAIDVESSVFPIGRDADGALEAPQPGPNLNHVAWYEDSPTPGQLGPSVLEGHVDTDQGRSVFYRLGDVRPGDKVTIKREDGRVAAYAVDAVRSYGKTEFPTDLVYGADLSRANLRLITCSDFDRLTRHYVGNLVVFGHLTSISDQP